MASEFEELFGEWGIRGDGTPNPLTVEPYLGVGSTGRKYAAGISHPGLVQLPQQRLVRGADGNEALSSTLVYVPLELEADFPLHSRVTLADGRPSTILTIGRPDIQGLFGFIVLNLE